MNRYELAVALSEINSFDEARRNDICAEAIEVLTAAAPAPAEQPVNAWKEAVIESCMVSHIGCDENDAAKSLRQLIAWEVQVALDPQVSSEAQALIDRGRSAAVSEITFATKGKPAGMVASEFSALDKTVTVSFDTLENTLGFHDQILTPTGTLAEAIEREVAYHYDHCVTEGNVRHLLERIGELNALLVKATAAAVQPQTSTFEN